MTPQDSEPLPWRFAGSCVDPALGGGAFIIDGLNVWDYKWEQEEGQYPEVRDPAYKQRHIFAVFTISNGERSVTFAAGEFSNCVWGFYTRSAPEPLLTRLRNLFRRSN